MRETRRPIAIDLFCGAGGLSLGFEQAGYWVAAAVDSSSLNISAYSRNFPSTKAIRSKRFAGQE